MTMPSELERLDEILARQYKQNGYVTRDGLRQSIAAVRDSAGPVTKEYPRMLYLHGDRDRQLIVQNVEEETQAAAAGYIREAAAPYEEGFPILMIENPQKKRWGYRGVTLRSAAEKAEWQAAVNEADWIEDPMRQWGARPTGLAEIKQERVSALQAMIAASPLEELIGDDQDVSARELEPHADANQDALEIVSDNVEHEDSSAESGGAVHADAESTSEERNPE